MIDLAHHRDIEVVERSIMPDEFEKTDEVFVTGTAAEVTPVGQIDDHNFDVGDITRTLIKIMMRWFVALNLPKTALNVFVRARYLRLTISNPQPTVSRYRVLVSRGHPFFARRPVFQFPKRGFGL